MAQRADLKDHYRVLGVAPTATADEIRLAYRDAAKRLHPDRGGDADGQRFHELNEAYETLRDARRRMRYDASLTDTRRTNRRPPNGPQTASASTDKPRPSAGRTARPTGTPGSFPPARAMTLVSAALAVALLITLGLLWQAQDRSNLRGDGLDQAVLRAEAAEADLAELRARYRASTFIKLEDALARDRALSAAAPNRHAFLAEITFAEGSYALNDNIKAEIDHAVLALADVISAIPTGADWLILVEGYAGEAARLLGVSVAAWELSLMRLGTVTDYLTGQGLPPERLAVRFQAGFQPVGQPAADGNRVEIKLVCCAS